MWCRRSISLQSPTLRQCATAPASSCPSFAASAKRRSTAAAVTVAMAEATAGGMAVVTVADTAGAAAIAATTPGIEAAMAGATAMERGMMATQISAAGLGMAVTGTVIGTGAEAIGMGGSGTNAPGISFMFMARL